MRNNYSIKVRNKKKERKTSTLVKRRHMKGGNGEKWLLLGITRTEMKERKYNDPTNGGEIITFDYGGDRYDGGTAEIDIRGNYYNIELWKDLLKSKGENYFDAILQDGGQHLGPGFLNRRDTEINSKGINEIMQSLLKPNGVLILHGSLINIKPFFKNDGWIHLGKTIFTPFGQGREYRHDDERFTIFKNPKGTQGRESLDLPDSIKRLLVPESECQLPKIRRIVQERRREELDRELKIASETPIYQEYDYSWPGGRKITKKSKKRKSKFKKQSRKK
jgi:hypothetical protein